MLLQFIMRQSLQCVLFLVVLFDVQGLSEHSTQWAGASGHRVLAVPHQMQSCSLPGAGKCQPAVSDFYVERKLCPWSSIVAHAPVCSTQKAAGVERHSKFKRECRDQATLCTTKLPAAAHRDLQEILGVFIDNKESQTPCSQVTRPQ